MDAIVITHTAKTRRGFALGALLAAEWIKGKKGFFEMKDLLNSQKSNP
jgi:4-hydroxy-tetrahydrodipicolinate reductase